MASPRWLRPSEALLFDRVLWALVGAVATFGAVMLLAAAFAGAAPALGLVAAGFGAVAGFLHPPAVRAPSALGWPTAIASAVVVVATAFNALHSGEHLLQDRDPGVYATTAVWVSDHHQLQLPGLEGPFRDLETASATGTGFYEQDAGRSVVPQFLHLLPVLQAGGRWLGGLPLLFALNALLGGLAMVVLFGLASELVGGWPAVAATTVLTVSLPQLWFARDSFSEVPAQLFLLAGLWALVMAVAGGRRWPALAGGLLLGTTTMARLDLFVLATPLVAWAALETSLGARHGARTRARCAAPALVGFAVTSTIAVLDGVVASRPYLSLLRKDVAAMAGGLVLAVLGAAVLVLTRRWWLPAAARLADRRQQTLAAAVGVLAVVAGFGLWFVRPAAGESTGPSASRHVGALQEREGAEVEPQRTYVEATMPRLAGYLGPVGLAAGILGTGLLAARAVRGDRRLWPVLALLGTPTVLYLVNIRIVPDQIWAIRRFLPATLPLLSVGSAALVGLAWQRRSVPARAGAIALVGIAIAHPLATVVPVADIRPHAGTVAAIRSVCADAGDRGAVLVLEHGDLHVVLPQVIRSMCKVPVATVAVPDRPADLAPLARAWRHQGRELLVLTAPGPFPAYPGATRPVTTLDTTMLEVTLERRPAAAEERRWDIEALILPSDGADR